jgi:MFS family permease
MDIKAQGASARTRSEWWVLAAAVFVGFFDTFALLPVLPVYVRQLGAEEWQIGIAVSTYSLVGLLVQVAGGYIADRVGRKRPMVVGFLGAAVALGLYAAVPSVWWVVGMRVLHGATGALFVPALFALIGERAGLRRAEVMGRVGALIGLAAILAPPLGGIGARVIGAPAVFVTIAVLMALMAVLVWRTVPETLTGTGERELKLLEVVRVPTLLIVYAVTAAFTFCMGVLAYGFPLLVVERGYTTATAGQLLGGMALVAVPVMAYVRWGQPLARALLGLGLIAGCLALLWYLHDLGAFALVMGLYGIGFGLVFPAIHVLTFDAAPPQLRGTAFAALYVAYSGGIILGPVVAGSLSGYVLPGLLGASVAAGVAGGILTGQVWGRLAQWMRTLVVK